MDVLDWTNPAEKISAHFTVKEALWLPQWGRLANEQDGLTPDLQLAIYNFCVVLDAVRDMLGCPMNVHNMYRPNPYSVLVGGHAGDVHTMGIAVDFDCNPSLSCDEVKANLLPNLELMGLRMEDNGAGASWVHIDTHAVIHQRFFKA